MKCEICDVCLVFFSHGTRCAGEVSAVSNNNICGVGVAYNSKVAGTSLIGSDSDDLIKTSYEMSSESSWK